MNIEVLEKLEQRINDSLGVIRQLRDEREQRTEPAPIVSGVDEKKISTIKEKLKNQIKNSDAGTELLKYFNHSIGMHDNWLIIPLRLDFLRAGSGILKLRLDDNLSITNLVLSLDDSNNWEFKHEMEKTDELSIFFQFPNIL